MYINDGGVENVGVRVIQQARKDFIKGGKILYNVMNKIPTYKELLRTHFRSLSMKQEIKEMYDAWRFVRDDPYSFFGDIGEEAVINQWKKDTIIAYYKELYLEGAVILYSKRKPNSKKPIHKLADNTVKTNIGKKNNPELFIKARNYILNLSHGQTYIDEWNEIAEKRIKTNKKGGKPIKIQDTEYAKNRSKKKQENIKKAKELREHGLKIEEIAKKLDVTKCTVNVYLRS